MRRMSAPTRRNAFPTTVATLSLRWIIFVGACVVLPLIARYTVFSYLVSRGKAMALEY